VTAGSFGIGQASRTVTSVLVDAVAVGLVAALHLDAAPAGLMLKRQRALDVAALRYRLADVTFALLAEGGTVIKYGVGAASAVALALAAAAGPGSASMASRVQVSGTVHRAARAATVAWVVNQSVRTAAKGSVTPIDTATNTVIKNIPVSRNTTAVAITPDGKTAYVALNALRPGGRGAVIPVSTSTYRAGRPIKVASILPATMLITPNGKTLYAGDWDSGTVIPIRTATNTAGRPIKTGANPFAIAMAITPDGKTVYVVNEEPHGTVTPIDTAANAAGKNIKVGVTPFAIVITPDGKTAYVLNLAQGEPGKGTVTPINTAANTAGKPIPIKHAAFPLASNLMVITPDGKTLYAVSNTTLTPIDTATNTALPAIRVAPRYGLDTAAAITPDGRTVYVDGEFARSNRGFIVPVSTATGDVGKAIVVRGSPGLMAITPDGKTLYILRAGGPPPLPQDVIPVNTATNTVGKPINTGLQPVAIAITSGHRQR
jgi:YVTN family beta-propeller protein